MPKICRVGYGGLNYKEKNISFACQYAPLGGREMSKHTAGLSIGI